MRQNLEHGTVELTRHALEEMKKDRLEPLDIENVLEGGVVDPAEWERKAWRYRVRTPRITVIVEIEPDELLVVVTAWRNQK